MAKRTVINRAAKSYINTSDDSDILVQSINQSTKNEYEDERIDKVNAIDVEIKESANSQEFVEEDIPQVPYANYEPTSEPQQAWPQGQQASTQAPQAVVQSTPTTESQSKEVMWNL
jgi:recombination protein RecT